MMWDIEQFKESFKKEILRKIFENLQKRDESSEDIKGADKWLEEEKILREIPENFFPKETEKLFELIRDTEDDLQKYRNLTSIAFDNFISEVAGIETKETEDILEHFAEPYYKAIETIRKFQDNLTKLFIIRPFASAVCVSTYLMDLKQRGGEEYNITFTFNELLKVWTKVAEYIYAESYGLKISDLFRFSNKLSSMGRFLLRRKIEELRDSIAKGDRSRLSVILRQRRSITKLKLGAIIVGYLTDHFLSLKNLKDGDLGNRDVRDYIKKLLVDRGILEYEIYSFLVRSGIPVIPNVNINIRFKNEEQKNFEIDILAVNLEKEKLLGIEVTSRENERDIREKVNTLSNLKETLEVESIVITTEYSCDIVESCDVSYPPKCISYEQPRKIIKAIKRL